MSRKVGIESFAKEINSIMTAYEKDVVSITKEETDKTTTGALKVLKKNAPVRTGAYKKSLARTKLSENAFGKTNLLYSKRPEYRKTHLLEHGYLTRSGKRSKSFPHFKYADDYIQDNLEKNIGENIEKLK